MPQHYRSYKPSLDNPLILEILKSIYGMLMFEKGHFFLWKLEEDYKYKPSLQIPEILRSICGIFVKKGVFLHIKDYKFELYKHFYNKLGF